MQCLNKKTESHIVVLSQPIKKLVMAMLAICFLQFYSVAQNINGEEITVGKESITIINFPSDVLNMEFDDQGAYDYYVVKRREKKSISIQFTREKPTGINASLFINEGGRSHFFRIIYDSEYNINDNTRPPLWYDHSNLKELKVFVNNQKKGGNAHTQEEIAAKKKADEEKQKLREEELERKAKQLELVKEEEQKRIENEKKELAQINLKIAEEKQVAAKKETERKAQEKTAQLAKQKADEEAKQRKLKQQKEEEALAKADAEKERKQQQEEEALAKQQQQKELVAKAKADEEKQRKLKEEKDLEEKVALIDAKLKALEEAERKTKDKEELAKKEKADEEKQRKAKEKQEAKEIAKAKSEAEKQRKTEEARIAKEKQDSLDRIKATELARLTKIAEEKAEAEKLAALEAKQKALAEAERKAQEREALAAKQKADEEKQRIAKEKQEAEALAKEKAKEERKLKLVAELKAKEEALALAKAKAGEEKMLRLEAERKAEAERMNVLEAKKKEIEDFKNYSYTGLWNKYGSKGIELYEPPIGQAVFFNSDYYSDADTLRIGAIAQIIKTETVEHTVNIKAEKPINNRVEFVLENIIINDANVYYKLKITNNTTEDFIMGKTVLYWYDDKYKSKQSINWSYITNINFFPLVKPGTTQNAILVTRLNNMLDDESLVLFIEERRRELGDTYISIPGKIFNTELSRNADGVSVKKKQLETNPGSTEIKEPKSQPFN